MTDNTIRSGSEGLSRRELLGKGVKLGGAVLWMTPAVQTFGMGRAFAAEPSGKCVVYCVKYEVDEGRWVALGSDQAAANSNSGNGRNEKKGGKGNCFTCPDEAVNGLPANMDKATVSGSPREELTVTLPPGCSVVDTELDSGSPDMFTGASAVAVKCGSQVKDGDDACKFHTVDAGTRTFTVAACDNDKAISNIEIIVKCCP